MFVMTCENLCQNASKAAADYLPHTAAVCIPKPPPTVTACRDVLDESFMHLAVAGKAQVLVTGDRGLLAIASAFEQAGRRPILTLDAFCSSFR
jgi:predicted nucleic acid-binding protein